MKSITTLKYSLIASFILLIVPIYFLVSFYLQDWGGINIGGKQKSNYGFIIFIIVGVTLALFINKKIEKFIVKSSYSPYVISALTLMFIQTIQLLLIGNYPFIIIALINSLTLGYFMSKEFKKKLAVYEKQKTD